MENTVLSPESTCAGQAVPSMGLPGQFPLGAFTGLLGRVAMQMAEVYQVPVCLPAMSALAVLSGAVGRSRVVKGAFKDKTTRLNLYVLAVAERGSGKGTIGETLMAPMTQFSKELSRKHQEEIASSKSRMGVLRKDIDRLQQTAATHHGNEQANAFASLENRSAELEQLQRAENRECALVVNNTTSEALCRLLADNHETLFSFSSEAGDALKVALGKYTNSGDFGVLLQGYSGDSQRIGRASRKAIELHNPCLSLLWMIQGSVLIDLLADKEAFSRGLTARPLIFNSGAKRERDNRRNDQFTLATEWSDFLLGVLNVRFSQETPIEIGCCPEARELFSDFHDESVILEEGPFSAYQGELSRWRENAIKVAGLLAIAEESAEITTNLAEAGISIVRWCALNYLTILLGGDQNRHQSDLNALLRHIDDSHGEISLGELSRNHGISRSDVETLIRLFPEQVTLQSRKSGSAGRPSLIVSRPTAERVGTAA